MGSTIWSLSAGQKLVTSTAKSLPSGEAAIQHCPHCKWVSAKAVLGEEGHLSLWRKSGWGRNAEYLLRWLSGPLGTRILRASFEWSPGASPALQGQDLHGVHSLCNHGRHSVSGDHGHTGHAVLCPALASHKTSAMPQPLKCKETRRRKLTGSLGCPSHDWAQVTGTVP